MMIDSMNESMGTNCKWNVQGVGYYVDCTGIPSALDPNNLYVPDHGTSIYSLLSAPSYYEDAGVIYGVGCYRGSYISPSGINSLATGFNIRPVVHLKQGYKLEWNNTTKKLDIVNHNHV